MEGTAQAEGSRKRARGEDNTDKPRQDQVVMKGTAQAEGATTAVRTNHAATLCTLRWIIKHHPFDLSASLKTCRRTATYSVRSSMLQLIATMYACHTSGAIRMTASGYCWTVDEFGFATTLVNFSNALGETYKSNVSGFGSMPFPSTRITTVKEAIKCSRWDKSIAMLRW
jgi:hypothetical protein